MYRLFNVLIIAALFSCSSDTKRSKGFVEKAFNYLKNGDFKKAYWNANTALQLDKENYLPFLLRGRALFEMDSLSAAQRDLLMVLKKDQTNTNALYYLGLVKYDLNEFESSISYLNKAVKSLGSDSVYFQINEKFSDMLFEENISMAEIIYFRGASYYYKGQYPYAENDFQFSLSENYNEARCFYFLGLIEINLRSNKEKGCDYLRRSAGKGYQLANDYILENCQ